MSQHAIAGPETTRARYQALLDIAEAITAHRQLATLFNDLSRLLKPLVRFDFIGLTLVDTAGLRESHDLVEAEGIRRARAELARADVAILVTDDEHADIDRELLNECNAGAVRLAVHNKIDLSGNSPSRRVDAHGETRIALSAHTGAGLDLLRAELARLAGRGDGTHGAFSARRRHVGARRRHVSAASAIRAEADERGRARQDPRARSVHVQEI